MTTTVADFSKDSTVYNISGTTREELDNKLNLFFTSEGYKFKGETNGERVYTKGNKALRVVLGAFWKYFRLAVAIKNSGDTFSVQIRKDASGFMGGVIGMQQVKKEFTRMNEAFKAYFS